MLYIFETFLKQFIIVIQAHIFKVTYQISITIYYNLFYLRHNNVMYSECFCFRCMLLANISDCDFRNLVKTDVAVLFIDQFSFYAPCKL